MHTLPCTVRPPNVYRAVPLDPSSSHLSEQKELAETEPKFNSVKEKEERGIARSGTFFTNSNFLHGSSIEPYYIKNYRLGS